MYDLEVMDTLYFQERRELQTQSDQRLRNKKNDNLPLLVSFSLGELEFKDRFDNHLLFLRAHR